MIIHSLIVMKIKYRLVAYACLFIFHLGKAQQTALLPGQSVPAGIQLVIHTGSNITTQPFDAFRDQPLLIVFWGSFCTSCLNEMPELESFLNAYAGKLRILLVTKDSEQKIYQLIDEYRQKIPAPPWVASIQRLPIVMGDTILYKLFEHYNLPVHAWVLKNLVLKGVAYNTSTTKENLARFINNQPFEIDEMEYKLLDPLQPAQWAPYGLRQDYTFFCNRIEYGGGTSGFEIELSDSISSGTNGISCINQTVLELYKVAYRKELVGRRMITDNRVLAPPDFISKVIFSQPDHLYFKWARQHTFCYASRSKTSTEHALFLKMRNDIDYYFGYKSKIEKREVDCIVLKTHPVVHTLINKNEVYSDSILIENGNTNDLFGQVSNEFRPQFAAPVLVNESPYRDGVTAIIRFNRQSKKRFEELNQGLAQYGLKLVREKRIIPMLVIRKK